MIRAYREDFFRKLISVHCTFIRDLRVRPFVVLSQLLIIWTPARSIVTYLFLKTLEIFWNFSKIIQKWFNQKHITGSIFAATFHTETLTETDFIFLFIYSCPSLFPELLIPEFLHSRLNFTNFSWNSLLLLLSHLNPDAFQLELINRE